MKHTMQVLLIVTVCICGAGCTTERGYSRITDRLELTEFFSADPQVERQDVWRTEDGVLICSGNPLGYLYSRGDIRDFTLKLEWRWPPGKKPGKGGVLIRMTGDHKIWPKSLEAQINAGDAGDFWGLAGYGLTGPEERTRSLEHQQFGKLTNVKKAKALENPAGQWNTYEIVAEGDTVTLIINGEQVNKATGCDLDAGKICLTSEGDEIHFRNMTVSVTSR
ncbi:MAG: 3-keto-disaccharide hydrolase [Planctomycetota bacterium]